MTTWNNQNPDTTGTYWGDILDNCKDGDIVINAYGDEFTVSGVKKNKKWVDDTTLDTLWLHLNKKDGTPNKQYNPEYWSKASDEVLWKDKYSK